MILGKCPECEKSKFELEIVDRSFRRGTNISPYSGASPRWHRICPGCSGAGFIDDLRYPGGNSCRRCGGSGYVLKF
jgi:hypothetical protein